MPNIIDTIGEFIIVELMISAIALLGYLFIYYIVYKKISHGTKPLNYKNALIFSVFCAYIFLVLNATILAEFRSNRGGINLELFHVYKKAGYSNMFIIWREIILNILMFVPIGFFLPILSKQFYKPYITLLLSYFFTINIEVIQLVTQVGSFDVDDLFNNFLGSVIGYCLAMSLLSSKFNKNNIKPKYFFIYISLLLIICFSFFGYFIYVQFKNWYNL